MNVSVQAKFAMRFVMVMVLLSVIFAPVSVASAAMRICRTDPIIWLSDGSKLTLTSSVAANASEIKQALYIVHVPMGVTATKIIYTADGLDGREIARVIADGKPGQYVTQALITLYAGAPVAVTYTLNVKDGIVKTVSGLSGQSLFITAVKP
jgi:hypothetical protein